MINKRLSVILLMLLYGQIHPTEEAQVSKQKPSIMLNSNSPKTITLYRDVNWRVYSTYYNKTSIYTCLPRIFEDKVTFREEKTNAKGNFLFKVFGEIIPRRYNINSASVTIWNLDPFDAMDLGVQAANPEIVQSCLEILPISRSSAHTGLSNEWRKRVDKKTGKLDITQKLTLNMESLSGKINRYRLIKALAFTGGLLSYFGLSNNSFFNGNQLTDDGFVSQDLFRAEDGTISTDTKNGTPVIGTLKPITITFTAVMALITQYAETKYINNHLRVYELLINSEKVCFNKAKIKSHLKKLHRKIRRFGLHPDASTTIQTLIAKFEK